MCADTPQDIDSVLDSITEYMRPKGWGFLFALSRAMPSQALLALTISDVNKQLLLSSAKPYVDILLDGLLLDEEHPRRGDANTDFEAVKGPVQKDFVECLLQLSLFEPGRQALLRKSGVVEALQVVSDTGWSSAARDFANAALLALSEKDRATPTAGISISSSSSSNATDLKKHIMISYQWNCQSVILRINAALQQRQYRTWLDVEAMQGSVMDAMAEAVDGCCCMLFGVSLAYKESGNCRLEANYGAQRSCDNITAFRSTALCGSTVTYCADRALFVAYSPPVQRRDDPDDDGRRIQRQGVARADIGDPPLDWFLRLCHRGCHSI